ncbi:MULTISPECIES: XRE family transcriptional regulator [Actinomadura]|uniref:XRE family transcriptional regulator n=1 Tax=Actinomadura yumaensis TaxID=111807 RepID=A0ABW2CEI3_9ACTN|nr:XRE family transcriptional regulator [Actinomadura sp. J1-007]MWK38053.1 XRE family transcriptional regulator [Actinomadura sp. J1-007]
MPITWAKAYAITYDIPRDELFPGPVGTVDQSATPDQGDDDVKRRAALQLITALGAGVTVPPGVLEELLSGIDRVLCLSSDIEEWERIAYDYGHQLYRRPFEVLIPALTADLVAVGELLKQGRPPRDQAGLLRVSAGLSGVLAETLSNMGDDRAARRTWHTARQAADASGDRMLRVWVRGRAAQNATWAGSSYGTVMTMVDEAVEIANDVPSSGLARAYAAGAYMAAFNGDQARANESLRMLKNTFERLPRTSSEPSVLEFQESQLQWNEAYVRTTFGGKKTSSAIENAEMLYPTTAMAPLTNLRLMRSMDLIRGREVREGLDLAVTSLSGRPQPVMAMRQLVSQILETLPSEARALPAARDLQVSASGT